MSTQATFPKVGAWVAVCLAAAIIGAVAGGSPSTAFSVALALAFIPVVFTWYTIGVGIFIFSGFLNLSGTAQKGLGALVILGGIAVLAEGHRGLSGNFFAQHKRITAVLLLYIAWAVLQLTWATSTHDVIYSLSRYIPNFLVFFVVYAAVDNRRDVLILAAFFVLGAAVAAGDAILSPPSASSDTVARAGGTFGDPNTLAAVLVTGFVLSVALNRVRSLGTLARAGAAVSAALCAVGILFSVSRGGLIAFSIALVTAVCISGRWRWKLGAISVLFAILLVSYIAFLAPAGDRQRLTSNSDGGSGRTTIWKVGWREVQANPVQGVGAGNFSVAGAKYVLEPGTISHQATSFNAYFVDTPTVAHNTYLEVLAEGGIVGMTLFMALIVGSLGCTRRAWLDFRRSGDRDMEILSYAVFAGLVGFLAASFFLSQEYSKQLYTLLALGPAILKVAPALAPRALRATPRRPRPAALGRVPADVV